MTPITPQLIEQTIKKCNEHMKARGLSKKTRDSYESMIRRFLFWEKENWERIEALPPEGRLEAFLSDLANDNKRPSVKLSVAGASDVWNGPAPG